ncbi:Two-component sensor histidine kinase, contains HisKA and HATPase domains [Sphingomonas sp. YR710]|uniref:sensor histidine kinase n=1 Tax=Sphingomonas sp. YR710 TaxID=1882773 RepID=UPI0008866D56|nr:sensor histidine kinase [Sphingomonas sp. YR710]SDC73438.1 Two-component sensor histidine kinase, contains HisKA and HATPase domains [Sphingomonas sp. YR710]
MTLSLKEMFSGWSSGTKMLLILSAALLPLGVIAMLTSLDTARWAHGQRQLAAQMAATMYAAKVDAAIDSRRAALHIAVDSAQNASTLCTALAGRAVRDNDEALPIAVRTVQGEPLCGAPTPTLPSTHRPTQQRDAIWIDANHRILRIASLSSKNGLIAETDLSLTDIRPRVSGSEDLPLIDLDIRDEQASASIYSRIDPPGQTLIRKPVLLRARPLLVIATFAVKPMESRTILLIMLPVLMWVAAAFTGWFIVKRLLLMPLAQLQQTIDHFRTGKGFIAIPRLNTPATEIQELATSFATASRQIIDHERELELGLQRQTRLTREVHHRVKNNLQVVSSLINLHARGVTNDAAVDAYATIQRRVDALAVVHRNHYAEMEENRGLSLRTLAGELASNLRASAPAEAIGMPIALHMISANVSQDVAVPVAFLITELVELMMHCNPNGSILISLEEADVPLQALLRIETLGLNDGAMDRYPGIARFDRIITGLARQLRATLVQDRQAGRFEIPIAILS